MEEKLIVDRDEFMEHRKKLEKRHLQQIVHSNNPTDSILTVEINTTELCNLKCKFCPRVDENIYPNQNLNMNSYVAKIIAQKLKTINYIGRISFSGYGENLLNPSFPDIIAKFRSILGTENIIECNTNGVTLTSELISKLKESGLSYLYVNLYDPKTSIVDIEKKFDESSMNNSQWCIRDHTDQSNYGLFLNNRSGMLKGADDQVKINAEKKCHYPFYKMMIDWNANVLFCTNDWGRKRIIGNLLHHEVADIWLSHEMNGIRKKLINGDRSLDPCSTCSVNGSLFGEESANLLMNHITQQDEDCNQWHL